MVDTSKFCVWGLGGAATDRFDLLMAGVRCQMLLALTKICLVGLG